MSIRLRQKVPNARGASLALVVAVLGFFALAVIAFSLKFTGTIGNYNEQKSTIEAAALAVARDASRIVIDDPNFGLIGLSDYAPTGSNTTAADGYRTSVTGINTLLGTIRLDVIIADYLQDPVMGQLALNDYNNALIAQTNLVTALNNAIVSGGTAKDYNGKVINPKQDALDTYNSNAVHNRVGATATLVTSSLKISLGYGKQLPTRTQVPQPASVSNVSSAQQSENCYLPDQDISYDNKDFVFAAVGAEAALVDGRFFQTSVSNVPYSTPTVVKVEADEKTTSNSADDATTVIHAMAAALPGCVTDQRPNPGFFSISFPNGAPPEINHFIDTINNQQIWVSPTDIVQTPQTGDYPQTALSQASLPMLPDPTQFNPQFANVLSLAMYDWIKRGGTNVNVSSLIAALQAPFAPAGGGGQMQRFHLTSSGSVTNDSVPLGQMNVSVSHKQFRAISGLALVSTNGKSYDLQLTDYTRNPGRTNGGRHAGEPLEYPGQSVSNSSGASYVPDTMYENTTWSYEASSTGSNAVRPTYNNEGIAVDFTFRQRQ